MTEPLDQEGVSTMEDSSSAQSEEHLPPAEIAANEKEDEDTFHNDADGKKPPKQNGVQLSQAPEGMINKPMRRLHGSDDEPEPPLEAPMFGEAESENDEHQPEQESGNANETSPDSPQPMLELEEEEEDQPDADETMTSNTAKAMAAVAAAATAQPHLSPSEQAEAARAVAPTIVPEATITMDMGNRQGKAGKREVLYVKGSAVKDCLRRRLDSTARSIVHESHDVILNEQTVAHHLAQGENDSFLQFLLLMEYFMTEDEVRPGSIANLNITPERLSGAERVVKQEKDPNEQDRTLAASEKVRSMLNMAEDAYEGMVALLPKQPPQEETREVEYDSSSDAVPDLLPPGNSGKGDATSRFFRACNGESMELSDSGFSQITKKREDTESTQANTGDGNEAEADDTTTVASDLTDEDEKKENHTVTEQTPSSSPQPALTQNGTVPRQSMFSHMFSSMRRGTGPSSGSPNSGPRSSFNGMFRRRQSEEAATIEPKIEEPKDETALNDDYIVTIDREMLGLTVENVLERTVVRTVLPGGAAKKAGAKVGSLIVKVGNVETRNLTHFETIDELRQSQRPLKLTLRPISSDSLRAAREEMGRLIRGGGFGASVVGDEMSAGVEHDVTAQAIARLQSGTRPNKVERFSQILRQRWSTMNNRVPKKEQSLLEAGEKLVWIMTLLTIGLEREASKQRANQGMEGSIDFTSPTKRSTFSSQADYAEAARSVSKVLYDFVNPQLTDKTDGSAQESQGVVNESAFPPHIAAARKKKGPPQPMAQAKGKGPVGAATEMLLRIGDVLHRTMSFLADPASPPAALLRGEVVAFLCDVLDIDSEMELSEDEAESQSTSGEGGPINDLGPAGSLLKLIILNCSMMQGPDVEGVEQEQGRSISKDREGSGSDVSRFHAGNRFLAVVHRLAASRSISARVTACSLGPVLWGHLDFPHQLQLRGVITRALHDVDVIVRKATATVLHEIAELVFDSRAVPWLVLMCERAMTDPEPQLRAAAMTLTWHLADHLPNAFLGDASQGSRSLRRLPPRTDPTFAEVYLLQCKLLPVATRLAEDRAASVRLAVAAQCDRLCNALGDHWYNIIVDVLQALLTDADERVRGEAILCFPRLAEIVLVSTPPVEGMSPVGVGILEALLPVAIKLQKDTSVNVRVSLATAAGELLTLLHGLQSLDAITQQATSPSNVDTSSGTIAFKKYVDETLIPLLQQLLHDVDPEVTSSALRAVTNASRGNVREIQGPKRKYSTATEDDCVSISSFGTHASSIDRKDPVFIPVLSESQVLRLLPTLSGLANSSKWRVRQGAVEIVPALLGCTHKLETRSEIAQLCFRLMSDSVDAVRRTAAECLCVGGGGLGSHPGAEQGGGQSEWMIAIVIPHVQYCSVSTNSKQRILSLKMIEVILTNGVCPPKPKNRAANKPSPQRELIEVALALSKDNVANVRLNVGRMFFAVLGCLPAVLADEEVGVVIQTLQDQLEAEESREIRDRDVIWFAQRAVARAKAGSGSGHIDGVSLGGITTSQD